MTQVSPNRFPISIASPLAIPANTKNKIIGFIIASVDCKVEGLLELSLGATEPTEREVQHRKRAKSKDKGEKNDKEKENEKEKEKEKKKRTKEHDDKEPSEKHKERAGSDLTVNRQKRALSASKDKKPLYHYHFVKETSKHTLEQATIDETSAIPTRKRKLGHILICGNPETSELLPDLIFQLRRAYWPIHPIIVMATDPPSPVHSAHALSLSHTHNNSQLRGYRGTGPRYVPSRMYTS